MYPLSCTSMHATIIIFLIIIIYNHIGIPTYMNIIIMIIE